MVAERDDVGPGGEDCVGLLRRHADDVGVFAVDDGEINVFLLLKRAQSLSQERQAGRAHNVAHGQNAQDHNSPTNNIVADAVRTVSDVTDTIRDTMGW